MIYEVEAHRVKHGSITDGIDDLMNGQMADIFYCDPPWGAGTLKAFETLNHKMGESASRVELNDFLVTLFDLAVKHSTDLVFIEYGIKWKDQVIQAGTNSGLKYQGTADAVYKSGSKILPHHVHVFSKISDLSPGYFTKFNSIPDSEDLVHEMIRPFVSNGAIVLDPCCGFGATAGAAKRLECTFYGNELTKQRLDKTLKRLSK